MCEQPFLLKVKIFPRVMKKIGQNKVNNFPDSARTEKRDLFHKTRSLEEQHMSYVFF